MSGDTSLVAVWERLQMAQAYVLGAIQSERDFREVDLKQLERAGHEASKAGVELKQMISRREG